MAEARKGAVNQPPPLARTESGDLQTSSLADVIGWFLDHDERVAIMRHASIDELFQWKQNEARGAGAEVAPFDRAEDRFAVGIFQALAENPSIGDLHQWLSDLVQALNDARTAVHEMAEAFQLNPRETSPIRRAEALPTERERRIYLTCCWLEALCTAEARVLGWVYQELYRVPFDPQYPPRVN